MSLPVIVKKAASVLTRGVSMHRTMASLSKYQTLSVTSPSEYVFHVQLNRPEKLNAFNHQMWLEIAECFDSLGSNPDCRAVVLSGAGEKCFTAGLDLSAAMELGSGIVEHDDIARKSNFVYQRIREYQNSLTSLELCPKPVIAAVHGHCIGAGVDIISAADIRYCSQDAKFQVKEVDIGMAADVGTLQRLPKIIGSASLVNELALTARVMLAEEARQCGLVGQVFPDKATLVQKSLELAGVIASKSPVAVQTTKRSIIYSRDHTVAEGLDHVALQNMTMLQSEDFLAAVSAQMRRDGQPAVFAKL